MTGSRDPVLTELFRDWDGTDRPGCAVGVVEDGKLVSARGFGMADLEHGVPITPTTVFHVASLSKQFTAFLIMLLERKGQLSLDDDIRTHLPEIPEYGRTITLRHLIHHTSGLRDQWTLLNLAGWREHDVVTNADVLDLATRQRELDFSTGDEYQYCNTGYTLLGLIVERVTGQSLRAYAQEQIFGPLGMTSTHFHDDHTMIVPHRAYAYVPSEGGEYRISIPAFDTVGATSLFTTVEDLARWVQRWLAPAADDSAINANMLANARLNDGTILPYAGGLSLGSHRGVPMIGHSGGDAGYRAHLAWFPEQHFGAIVLGNISTMSPEKLVRQVTDRFLGDRLAPVPPPPAIGQTPSTDLASRAGLYWNPRLGKVRRLEYRDGTLRLVLWPGYSPELIPVEANRFVVPSEDIEISFTDKEKETELRETAKGFRAEVSRSVNSVQLSIEQLAEYVGDYHSDEVGTTWSIRLNADNLVAGRPKFAEQSASPAFEDCFLLNGWDPIVFHRGDQRQIDGLALSSFRLRHLFFRRTT
jgi:CubicO group peptidase (beta-lactamase class C family)